MRFKRVILLPLLQQRATLQIRLIQTGPGYLVDKLLHLAVVQLLLLPPSLRKAHSHSRRGTTLDGVLVGLGVLVDDDLLRGVVGGLIAGLHFCPGPRATLWRQCSGCRYLDLPLLRFNRDRSLIEILISLHHLIPPETASQSSHVLLLDCIGATIPIERPVVEVAGAVGLILLEDCVVVGDVCRSWTKMVLD